MEFKSGEARERLTQLSRQHMLQGSGYKGKNVHSSEISWMEDGRVEQIQVSLDSLSVYIMAHLPLGLVHSRRSRSGLSEMMS